MNPTLIDPSVVTLVQSTFLDNIDTAFSIVSNYAFNLLYLFAALELVILGFAWALQREIGWDKLFFKVMKIGLIFFIIDNYSWLFNSILETFARLAGTVIDNEDIAKYVFNPAKIWQYGYDAGVHLLQLASTNTVLGLSMIQVSLGMGILLVFGLLGIQMILQMVSFYLVSFTSLILLPFGTLSISRNMLDKAIQSVLKAGVRLMVLIIIIGIAVLVWDTFDFTDLKTTTSFNINQPLGLFFTALLFLSLALYLPNIVSQAVGDLSGTLFESAPPQPTITVQGTAAGLSIEAPSAQASNVQAAATIGTPFASSTPGSTEVISSTATAATVPTAISGVAGSGLGIDSQASKADLAKASAMSKSISENTVKNIKEAITEAMKEKGSK